MWRITKIIEIRQPIELVFGYLRYFQNIREWDPSVVHARPLFTGEPGNGSRFELMLRFGFQRVPMVYEITALKEGAELVLTGLGSSFEARDHIRFESIAGGTRLVYRAEVFFHRPPGKIANTLMKSLFTIGADRSVKRLRTMLSGDSLPPRLTAWTKMADRTIIPGLMEFSRAGYRLAVRRRPVASALYSGKTVLITGGTSGIGKAAVAALFAKGANVMVVGRNRDKLERLSREVRSQQPTGRVETETADLSRMSDIRQLAGRIENRVGHIDVLINNAGALFNGYGETVEGLERTLAVNLAAPYLLTHLLLPLLKNAGDARIINVSSGGMYTQGLHLEDFPCSPAGYDGPTAYARAKRGLVVLTEIWAKEMAPLGIRVHAMHPGWVNTPGLKQSLPSFYGKVSRWLRSPAQGADTIVWLAAAPDAARVTGTFWLDRKIRLRHVLPGTRETAEERRELTRRLDEFTGLARKGVRFGADTS